MKKSIYVFGFIASFLISTAILFKIMHWPAAGILLFCGVVILNLGFLPAYFYNKYKNQA
ncbi:hypothetical protein [Flavobacterium sp.]|uniref:hypothetical protein n=1 Tax=Flavobacterium sp. TaxID=239 RepID=UPI003A8ED20C